MKKTVWIIGAKGFIGINLTSFYKKKNFKVIEVSSNNITSDEIILFKKNNYNNLISLILKKGCPKLIIFSAGMSTVYSAQVDPKKSLENTL